MRDGAGLHYYGYDAHSGVRLLMNGSGAITDTWDYDGFGNVIGRTGSTGNEFLYRSERRDPLLGWDFLRKRWMNPWNGRFGTMDTIIPSSKWLHAYVYGSNDPIDRKDPGGRFDLTDVAYGSALAIVPTNPLSMNSYRLVTGSGPGVAEQPPDIHSSMVTSNYNSAEVYGFTADELWDRNLRTFAGVNQSGVATVTGAPVNGIGNVLTFSLTGGSSYLQNPFSVKVKRFDPVEHTFSAVTLQGHPLAGYRYWHIQELDAPDHLRVETGAVDGPAPGLKNILGFYLVRQAPLQIWEREFEYIPWSKPGSVIQDTGSLGGVWNYDQGYILDRVCGGATWCPR
jgi:RHS repeat-associated protein